MKLDKATRLSVLKRLEAADVPSLEYKYYEYDRNEDCSEEFMKDWSAEQAYCIDLMIEEGLVKKFVISGERWQEGGDSVIRIQLTNAGHEYIENNRCGWLRRQWTSLKNGLFTIIAAVILSWALYYFGAPNK